MTDELKKAHPKPQIPERFRTLLGVPVPTPARATRMMDGRLVPIVFANLADPAGMPYAGIRVELLDDKNHVVDSTRTSDTGLAILRFPPRPVPKPQPEPEPAPAPSSPSGTTRSGGTGTSGTGTSGTGTSGGGTTAAPDGHGHHSGDTATLPEVKGSIRVADGTRNGFSEPVTVRAGEFHTVKDLVTEKLDERGAVPLAGDEQISRLPVDFSPATCGELGARLSGLLTAAGPTKRNDPLIPPPATGQLSLAGQRTAIVRHADVVRRVGDKRYLVKLRQEWVLLGYTLGELAKVTALDPGSIVQEANQVIDQVSTVVRDTTDTVRSSLTETLSDAVSSFGSVDTVVRATASVSGGAVGGFLGIPGLGIGGGYGWMDSSATVDTSVNTSLLVNRSLQQVSTLVNQAIAHAEAVAQGSQRTVNTVLNHLAPLVSKVTNALHWRVYENYAVCSHVEGVLEIAEFPVNAGDTFRFDEFWARALRAYLEPALIDRTLVKNFANLAVLAETPGLGSATVEIRYSAFSIASPGRAVVSLGGTTTTILLPGGTDQTVRRVISFPTPLVPGTRVTGSVTFVPGEGVFTIPGTLTVQRFSVWIDNPLIGPGDQVNDSPSGTVPIDVQTEGGVPVRSGDALIQHLNANRAYYLDVLAAAAIRFPALRVDAARDGGPLSMLPDQVFELPVVGFEGNRVLVAQPIVGTPPTAVQLLERDSGSGTLVQLLAPGAYGEVFQGVSALTALAENLHPALKAIAPPQFPDFPTLPVLPPVDDGLLDGVSDTVGDTVSLP